MTDKQYYAAKMENILDVKMCSAIQFSNKKHWFILILKRSLTLTVKESLKLV